jgi:hypothetical protein
VRVRRGALSTTIGVILGNYLTFMSTMSLVTAGVHFGRTPMMTAARVATAKPSA